MKSAAAILKEKLDPSVHTIGPEASVFEALERMAQHNVGALLVMQGERLAGIVSERDYARKVILLARSSRDLPVRAIMSSPVMYVRPDQTSEECMALMTEKRLRHLPVVEAGKVVGIVSIGDLVKSIVAEQRFIIEQLEHYIAGDRGV
ncbi:CBS domain-containing protein [Aromatoleum anaerobium]|uniref:CBS domain-containing protein n=1 Tax=Aromatoleum anaerobium TaxID=182180 RepID=A0ABX1PIA0_9RHOO|nr:CBS domain-containing protein [Aromatoleum anaerobium]MCK0508770.1 CBS domain-containing protein [Aromatoleum anaerobium]